MMNTGRRRAVAALTAAGVLWGMTVPLSKLALEWLPPGWLTFARFGLAAAILLAATRGRAAGTAAEQAPRTELAAGGTARAPRTVWTPGVLASGAFGYGGSVVVQNAGITRTSVTHAALLIGAVPVLVAVIAALWHRTVARPVAWAGFAVSLAGVALVTGGRGGGASAGGDALVLASLLLSATFTVAQARLLRGRDPIAVTAVQFVGAALAVLPFSAAAEGIPPAPHSLGPAVATVALAAGGTLLPFTLFAFGQSRVPAEVAGAFVNIEPLIGAVAGIVVFGDPAGPAQALGGAAIIAGIALSSLPLLRRAGVVEQGPRVGGELQRGLVLRVGRGGLEHDGGPGVGEGADGARHVRGLCVVAYDVRDDLVGPAGGSGRDRVAYPVGRGTARVEDDAVGDLTGQREGAGAARADQERRDDLRRPVQRDLAEAHVLATRGDRLAVEQGPDRGHPFAQQRHRRGGPRAYLVHPGQDAVPGGRDEAPGEQPGQRRDLHRRQRRVA